MKPITILLDDAEIKHIKEIQKRKKWSKSMIMRELIKFALKKYRI